MLKFCLKNQGICQFLLPFCQSLSLPSFRDMAIHYYYSFLLLFLFFISHSNFENRKTILKIVKNLVNFFCVCWVSLSLVAIRSSHITLEGRVIATRVKTDFLEEFILTAWPNAVFLLPPPCWWWPFEVDRRRGRRRAPFYFVACFLRVDSVAHYFVHDSL